MRAPDIIKAFRGGLLALCALCIFVAVPSDAAAVQSGFQADVLYADSAREPRKGGTVMTSGEQARIDVRLEKAGEFSLIVDMQGRRMQVLSQKLKGYVETSIEGEPHSWRDLFRSVSSMLLPQTLGLVSLQEKSSEDMGRERIQGLDAVKSRHVFTLGFLGSYRDISVIVWEHPAVAPFPLKAEVLEDDRTRGASVWLGNVRPVPGPEDRFFLPEGFSRFTSVLDLILYALASF